MQEIKVSTILAVQTNTNKKNKNMNTTPKKLTDTNETVKTVQIPQNKQGWLDLENPGTEEWMMQQLLVNMTKTELLRMKSTMTRLRKILYRSKAQETSLINLSILIDAAEEVARKDDL